jgi:hypothetical protein
MGVAQTAPVDPGLLPDGTDRGVARALALCGPVFLILFMIGFWFVGGFVPPPKPTGSAADVAAFYLSHTGRIRAGTLITMIGVAFFAPFQVIVTMRMRSRNPRLAPLAYVQLVCGIALLLMILLPVSLLALASFRPDRPAESTQLLNDAGIFMLFWVFSTPTLEYVAMGAAALMDRGPDPLFPRWVGWYDLLVAVLFATGAPVVFVKDGVFAWDGLLAFWLVLFAFGGWVLITFWFVYQDVRRPALERNST